MMLALDSAIYHGFETGVIAVLVVASAWIAFGKLAPATRKHLRTAVSDKFNSADSAVLRRIGKWLGTSAGSGPAQSGNGCGGCQACGSESVVADSELGFRAVDRIVNQEVSCAAGAHEAHDADDGMHGVRIIPIVRR